MPSMPKRPCSHPGCGVLTDNGRCTTHRAQLRKEQDAQRSNSYRRGYGPKWQKARQGWLRVHPLCGDRLDGAEAEHSQCMQQQRIGIATDVDHIVAVNGPTDPLFWRPSNWQSLCHSCHSMKTAKEDGGFTGKGEGRVESLQPQPKRPYA